MIAVFDELGVDYVDTTDGALRLGVLYDLLGRSPARRHAHGHRGRLHAPLWRGSPAGRAHRRACRCASTISSTNRTKERRVENRMFLGWAAALRRDRLVDLAQRRITSIRPTSASTRRHAQAFAHRPGAAPRRSCSVTRASSARLSQTREVEWRCCSACGSRRCYCRRRADVDLPGISVAQANGGYRGAFANEWVANNPLDGLQPDPGSRGVGKGWDSAIEWSIRTSERVRCFGSASRLANAAADEEKPGFTGLFLLPCRCCSLSVAARQCIAEEVARVARVDVGQTEQRQEIGRVEVGVPCRRAANFRAETQIAL